MRAWEPFRRRFAAGKATVLGVFSRRAINGMCRAGLGLGLVFAEPLVDASGTRGSWMDFGAVPSPAQRPTLERSQPTRGVYEGLGSDHRCCRSIRTNLPSYHDPHLQKLSSPHRSRSRLLRERTANDAHGGNAKPLSRFIESIYKYIFACSKNILYY